MKTAITLITALALMALAVLGLSRPSHASDVANWGGTFCKMEPAMQQEHIAKVTCVNVLTGGVTNNRAVMSVGELSVGIVATMGPGRSTDRFEVVTPEGFIAVPPMIDLQEGASGSMLIFALGDMVLG